MRAAAILSAMSAVQQATAILSPEREILPDKFKSLSAASAGTLSLWKRLPTVREFVAAGGDWTAFQRHFKASCALVGWSDKEALRALPMALDDDSLAVFEAIPEADRAMLPRAYTQMAAIFDPPSNARRRFVLRRRGEAEMPLAFHSMLLALGHAAYPRMEHTALERLLSLAQELGVSLPVMEEDDLSSLKVARCIQDHVDL
ncbi:unnamed protein product [Lampetra planeri]